MHTNGWVGSIYFQMCLFCESSAAVCCSVLQCDAVCYNMLQCAAVCCSKLHGVPVCYCVAVLQCVAVKHPAMYTFTNICNHTCIYTYYI